MAGTPGIGPEGTGPPPRARPTPGGGASGPPAGRARTRWGWGFEAAAIWRAAARAAAPGLVGLLGFGETEPEERVAPEAVELVRPRIQCPPHLRGICTSDDAARIAHAH